MRVATLRATGERIFAVVFDTGDEVSTGLRTFAREHGVATAHLAAIGALQDVTLGFWDGTSPEYLRIAVREQVEVLSMTGNIALGPDGTPRIHAHMVIGKVDGTAHGGHLLEGHVRPTLEVIVTELPGDLRRRIDDATGLALLRL